MRYAMNGVRQENSTYSLKYAGGTNYLLFISKVDPKQSSEKLGLFSPWRLIERQAPSLDYCLIAAGNRIEALGSAEYANPQKKYGTPGSGNQRCSDGKTVLDAIDVRLWANKELGKSFILHLNSEVGDRNFTYLMSNDKHWILIDEAKKNVAEACYYARGDAVAIHHDFYVPAGVTGR
ncbi:MAG: hypothetical protein GY751_17360 [Bacteroidetes bacterium]|nr:hypothetical protein [Bacteroidota bacterium]